MSELLSLAHINKALVENEISTENSLEENVLKYMPIIREIIKSGLDIDTPFPVLANTLDITIDRFVKLYTVAKKELQVQADFRGGPDMRLQHIHDIDTEINKTKKAQAAFIKSREDALAKFKRIQEQKASAIDLIEELDPVETERVYMKEVDYQRILISYTDMISKLENRRAKVAGVEVIRKEIIRKDASDFMEMLFGKGVIDRPDPVESDYIEIQPIAIGPPEEQDDINEQD